MASLRARDDGPLPGAVNMARDTALLSAIGVVEAGEAGGAGEAGETGGAGAAGPILRLYRWSPPAVSLGYHQDAAGFDAAAIAARGYDLVRRPTGGRAILHADELTYAVAGASQSPLFGATLHDAYRMINAALCLFLCRLGLRPDVSGGETLADARGSLCFRTAGQHEITVGGRKLIGSAQRRTEGAFLQHGSILAGPGHAELAELTTARTGGAAGAAAEAAVFRDDLLASTTNLAELLGRPLLEPDLALLACELAEAFAEAWRLDLVWESGAE